MTVCEQHLELWDLDRSASTAEVCCHDNMAGPMYTANPWLNSCYYHPSGHGKGEEGFFHGYHPETYCFRSSPKKNAVNSWSEN